MEVAKPKKEYTIIVARDWKSLVDKVRAKDGFKQRDLIGGPFVVNRQIMQAGYK